MQELKNDFKKISVVIPAFNKGSNLNLYLKTLAEEMGKLPYAYEIILINDGSQDNTLKSAIEYVNSSRQQNFEIITYPLNVGKGFALCYGFTKTTGDIIVFFDADLDLHPRQIHLLLEYMVHHNADIVIGSRRHPDSQTDYPLSRRAMSLTYQFLTRLLFGINIRDTQLGLKLFRREVLEEILPLLTIKKWVFDVEILVAARQNNFNRIVEAPIVLNHQPLGSTVNIATVYHILKDTAAIYYRRSFVHHYSREHQELAYPEIKALKSALQQR